MILTGPHSPTDEDFKWIFMAHILPFPGKVLHQGFADLDLVAIDDVPVRYRPQRRARRYGLLVPGIR